jgi:hypothetical protein
MAKEELPQATRDALLASAKELCDLMYRWNVVDIDQLVLDDGRSSVYFHTNRAMVRALELLGLNPDYSWVFYEVVTTGASASEALDAALERSRMYDHGSEG